MVFSIICLVHIYNYISKYFQQKFNNVGNKNKFFFLYKIRNFFYDSENASEIKKNN